MVAPKDGVCSAPGTGFESGEKNTALQGHVAFFDRDNDGVIWPTDTYTGFREIKFGVLLALLSTVIVHGGFSCVSLYPPNTAVVEYQDTQINSYVTCSGLLPDPFFRLYIRNMHRGIHGSDSGSYTKLGDFDINRCDHTFDMYSSDPHTHLTFAQGVRMLHGNMNPFDPFGWFAATFEWLATYIMLWPSDPRGMNKEDVKAVYNGSIFYQISGKKAKT